MQKNGNSLHQRLAKTWGGLRRALLSWDLGGLRRALLSWDLGFAHEVPAKPKSLQGDVIPPPQSWMSIYWASCWALYWGGDFIQGDVVPPNTSLSPDGFANRPPQPWVASLGQDYVPRHPRASLVQSLLANKMDDSRWGSVTLSPARRAKPKSLDILSKKLL